MFGIVSAPTNLGLRPPRSGSVPGTAKAPEALREAGLHRELIAHGARDSGVVLPGRFVDDPVREAGRIRNQEAIIEHAKRLAARIATTKHDGLVPLVIGGDCSVVIAAGVAMSSVAGAALVHVDGHTDFRHPGNSEHFGALAGEDLAAAVGRHLPEIAAIVGEGPYFVPTATVHLGCRDDDEHLDEAREAIGAVIPARSMLDEGLTVSAGQALGVVGAERPYWLQIDVDVLDPRWMPAVDSPDPGGIAPRDLVELLQELAPRAWGISITVFDPDLDPTGTYADVLTRILVDGLTEAR